MHDIIVQISEQGWKAFRTFISNLAGGQIGNNVDQYLFNGVPFVTFDSGSAKKIEVKITSFM